MIYFMKNWLVACHKNIQGIKMEKDLYLRGSVHSAKIQMTMVPEYIILHIQTPFVMLSVVTTHLFLIMYFEKNCRNDRIFQMVLLVIKKGPCWCS